MRTIARALILVPTLAWSADTYRVSAEGTFVQVSSPWGSKMFFADREFPRLTSYRMEIPIALLKPNSPNSSGGGSGGASSDGASEGSAMNGRSPAALIVGANRLYGRGNFREAMGYVDEAIRREPKNARAWLMKGSLHHALGQKDATRNAYQKALELDPQNETIRTILEKSQ